MISFLKNTRFLLTFPHLLYHSQVRAFSLNDSLRAAGIARVAFLRHGNTAPKPEGGIDFDRKLTEKGEHQAESAGSSFGISTLVPFYPAVLCSPAPRCIATAEIFLDAALIVPDDKSPVFAKKENRPELKLIPQLYDGTMQPEGSRLFRKFGYAPLRTYLENPDADEASSAKEILLGKYTQSFLEALVNLISTSSVDGRGYTLLFIGHAVYLPSAALGFVSALDDKKPMCSEMEGYQLILDTNTKEAEGYVVDLDQKKVSTLCRPEE